MRCARCSGEIPDGSGFCPACGLRLRVGPSVQVPQASTEPVQSQPVPATPPPQPAGYQPQQQQVQQPQTQQVQQPQAPTAFPYQSPADSCQAPPQGYFPPPGYAPGRPPVNMDGQPPGMPPAFPGYTAAATGPLRGGGGLVTDRNSMLMLFGIILAGLVFVVFSLAVLTNGAGMMKLATALMYLGIFAGVAVCGYVHLQRNSYQGLGIGVIITAGVAALFAVLSILSDSTGLAKAVAVTGTVAVLGAHTALLLLMEAPPDWFKIARGIAIGVTWLFGLVALIYVFKGSSLTSLGSGSLGGFMALSKAVAILAVLDVAATVVAILLWRMVLRMYQTAM